MWWRNISLQDAGLINAPLVGSKCVKLHIHGVRKTTLRKKLIDPYFLKFTCSQKTLRAIKIHPPTQGINLCTLFTTQIEWWFVINHAFQHLFMSSANQNLFAKVGCLSSRKNPLVALLLNFYRCHMCTKEMARRARFATRSTYNHITCVFKLWKLTPYHIFTPLAFSNS